MVKNAKESEVNPRGRVARGDLKGNSNQGDSQGKFSGLISIIIY